LTAWGQQRLFNEYTAAWSEFNQQLPVLIDTSAALDAIDGLSQRAANALRDLEDRTLSAVDTARLIAQSPDAFGGPDSPDVDHPNMPPIQDGQSAEQVCVNYPELGPIARDLGFDSCEDLCVTIHG